MRRLIIIGASGHGKVIADIAEKNGYRDIVFLDDNETVTECAGYPVLGNVSQVNSFSGDKIVAIGNSAIREEIQNKLDQLAILIHPSAVISRRVKISEGVVIMAGAIINSDTYIGRGTIINTGSSVDHDCSIGEFCHVSVGAHVAGTVTVGSRTWIGAGATVSNNVNICEDCMIGAGAVVVSNIERKGIYIGVPARRKN